jgi:hypothetical protein
MKSEGRNPNAGSGDLMTNGRRATAFGLRVSDFGLPSDFGPRISDFPSWNVS